MQSVLRVNGFCVLILCVGGSSGGGCAGERLQCCACDARLQPVYVRRDKLRELPVLQDEPRERVRVWKDPANPMSVAENDQQKNAIVGETSRLRICGV